MDAAFVPTAKRGDVGSVLANEHPPRDEAEERGALAVQSAMRSYELTDGCDGTYNQANAQARAGVHSDAQWVRDKSFILQGPGSSESPATTRKAFVGALTSNLWVTAYVAEEARERNAYQRRYVRSAAWSLLLALLALTGHA
jgi:hypothetical protein